MLIVDKYKPLNSTESFFHTNEMIVLETMAKDDSIPHLIFAGPEGCGKKTLIRFLLEKIYGPNVNKVVDSIFVVNGSGNTSIDVTVKRSEFHIIIEPNNTNFDRYIIRDVVKDYAKKHSSSMFTSNKKFKIVVINNLDNLPYYAQYALRRTIEQYSSTCRFIMWCNSLSRVIDPLKSRCYCFKVPAPKETEIVHFIMHVSYCEQIKMTLEKLAFIISSCDNSIRKSLWLLQSIKYEDTSMTSFDMVVNDINDMVMNPKFNLEDIHEIRCLLYSIMITNYTGSNIIKSMLEKLLHNNEINDSKKRLIINRMAHYEYNLIKGRHEIMHIEPIIISIVKILKS